MKFSPRNDDCARQLGQYIVVRRAELASVLRERLIKSASEWRPGPASWSARAAAGTRHGLRSSINAPAVVSCASASDPDRAPAPSGPRAGSPGRRHRSAADRRHDRPGRAVPSRQIEIRAGPFPPDVGVRNPGFGGDAFEKRAGQATAGDRWRLSSRPGVQWRGQAGSSRQTAIRCSYQCWRRCGLAPGDRFIVSAIARRLTDPASGAVPEFEPRWVEVVIVNVQPGYGVAQMAARSRPNAAIWSNRSRDPGLRTASQTRDRVRLADRRAEGGGHAERNGYARRRAGNGAPRCHRVPSSPRIVARIRTAALPVRPVCRRVAEASNSCPAARCG